MATARPFRFERCITEIHLRKGAILETIGLTQMGIYNKSARRRLKKHSAILLTSLFPIRAARSTAAAAVGGNGEARSLIPPNPSQYLYLFQSSLARRPCRLQTKERKRARNKLVFHFKLRCRLLLLSPRLSLLFVLRLL